MDLHGWYRVSGIGLSVLLAKEKTTTSLNRKDAKIFAKVAKVFYHRGTQRIDASYRDSLPDGVIQAGSKLKDFMTRRHTEEAQRITEISIMIDQSLVMRH